MNENSFIYSDMYHPGKYRNTDDYNNRKKKFHIENFHLKMPKWREERIILIFPEQNKLDI